MFNDREEAAHLLALELLKAVKSKDVVVIALPRGAVGMGKIIAELLNSSLDILVLKKMGAPHNDELAIGVLGPNKTIFLNKDIIESLRLTKQEVKEIRTEKENERQRLEKKLRRGKAILVKGKTVIVVDDGVATGATVLAAEKYLRQEGAKKIILATPVISKDVLSNIKKYFDMVICLKKPRLFYAVGQFYRNFSQVTDQEVIDLLK